MKYGYTLVIAWVAIFTSRLFLGRDESELDQLLLWVLRFLSVAILMQVGLAFVRFARGRVRAVSRGDPLLTEAVVRQILIGALAVGFACRVVTWGPEGQGVIGWAGTILVVGALAGFAALHFRNSSQ